MVEKPRKFDFRGIPELARDPSCFTEATVAFKSQNARTEQDVSPATLSTLVLSRHYAPEPIGSAPPIQQLAEWLAGDGRRPHVVTSRPSYPFGRIAAGYEHGAFDHVVENGVQVTRWPTMPINGGGLFRRVVPEGRFMAQILLARLSGKLKPQQSIISLCPSILTVLAALALRAKGGRHVAVVHDIQSGLGSSLGSIVVRPIMALLRRVERWTLNRTDHIIVLSKAMSDELRLIGVTVPVTILPPQVDCKFILPIERSKNTRPTLMYSGNLGRKQGIEQLIELAKVLRVRAPEVVIQIRGDGVKREMIADAIDHQHLSNVVLLPLVDQADVPRSLSEADVHLVPQLAEGGDFAVPSKAFAIMAAGRPFVTTATASSSIGRLADESGAFLCVPPQDADAFADAVLSLLNNPDRAAELGRRGRAYAERYADTDVVMQSIVGLL